MPKTAGHKNLARPSSSLTLRVIRRRARLAPRAIRAKVGANTLHLGHLQHGEGLVVTLSLLHTPDKNQAKGEGRWGLHVFSAAESVYEAGGQR